MNEKNSENMGSFSSCLKKCSCPCRCGCFKATNVNPMSKGEKFIVIEEDYLNKFDDIVVVGDIHGCYDEFKELIDKIHSETPSKNPNKCLKILVGDLVNKGPDSTKVLKLCCDKYPNSIIAVRGNHEETVLRLSEKLKLDGRNEWIKKLPNRYIKYMKSLPYSIKIPTLKCIIVHAGIDPSLEDPAVNTPLSLMTTMRNIEVIKNKKSEDTSYECTKDSSRGAAWANFWPGPEHVYFGHDAKRRLQDDHEFATGLDTGCVYGDRLTYKYLKGSRAGEICSIKAKKIYEPVKEDDD